jgi:signal transduction histidine kinase/ActR/RegA family two-component response regulator
VGPADLDDFYAITLPDDGTLNFTLTTNGGLQARTVVYNASGSVLLFGGFVTGGTTAGSVSCLAAGTVYVHVDRNAGDDAYTLDLSLASPVEANDPEPNGSIGTALSLPFTGSAEGHSGFGNGTVDQDDYYFGVPTLDGRVSIRIINDGAQQSRVLFYNDNRALLSSSPFSTDTVVFDYDCVTGGDTLYFQVDSNNGCGGYRLSYQVIPNGTPNDAEPNNSLAEAGFVGEGLANATTGHLGYGNGSDLPLDASDFFAAVPADDGKITLYAATSLAGVKSIGTRRRSVGMGRYRDLDWRYVCQLEDREKELERTVQERTRELEERNAELRRVQAFKEQFLANMSHEIRTPLNAIVGMGNLMAHSALDESQAAYLTYIREAARNLRAIVDEILDFSKLEAGHMELESVPFDPRATVDLVHQMLRFKTEEKGLYFRVELADDVPAVLIGDPTRLGQVLIILCGNAIKFTERGGVTVRFARTGEHGDPVRLRLSVRDTGIGIRPEHLEKIFEQFAQATTGTTRQFGGTGLGLSIARRIARLMGGDLTVESAFGEGTSFHADLVLAEGRPEDLAPETGPAAEVRDLGALRILLVEDNAFNVLVATGTLEMELPEATVDVAENGVRALERLDAERYDLVLMDIQMPEMDGYEATRRIREHADRAVRDLPVIAMTANVIKSERDRCLAVGMNACVAKPFEVEDLMDAIRAHVRA